MLIPLNGIAQLNLVVVSDGDDKKISLWRKTGESTRTIPAVGTDSGGEYIEGKILDWSHNGMGDSKIVACLKRGENPSLALVNSGLMQFRGQKELNVSEPSVLRSAIEEVFLAEHGFTEMLMVEINAAAGKLDYLDSIPKGLHETRGSNPEHDGSEMLNRRHMQSCEVCGTTIILKMLQRMNDTTPNDRLLCNTCGLYNMNVLVMPKPTGPTSAIQKKAHAKNKESDTVIEKINAKAEHVTELRGKIKEEGGGAAFLYEGCLEDETGAAGGLEDSYNLVKAKYGLTRLVEGLDLLLWGYLKTMFEPYVEDNVWRQQQGYKVLNWKLYDSCGVHSLMLQSAQIYMPIEKKYPLTPLTLSQMLEKKLSIDYESEMAYQLIKSIKK
ncbi:hypothetical protein Tco_0438995 [Tanacetum coccineum]